MWTPSRKVPRTLVSSVIQEGKSALGHGVEGRLIFQFTYVLWWSSNMAPKFFERWGLRHLLFYLSRLASA